MALTQANYPMTVDGIERTVAITSVGGKLRNTTMSQNKTPAQTPHDDSDDGDDLTMVQRWKIQDDIENKIAPPPTNPSNVNPK